MHKNEVSTNRFITIFTIDYRASINKVYGAIIAEEWQIRSVPTIIMFQHGKEIKRFEAGLSFRIDEDEIKRQINKEIEEIMLRRFQ